MLPWWMAMIFGRACVPDWGSPTVVGRRAASVGSIATVTTGDAEGPGEPDGATAPVIVRTAGGDDLVVSLESGAGPAVATLTGPAEVVFTGRWTD